MARGARWSDASSRVAVRSLTLLRLRDVDARSLARVTFPSLDRDDNGAPVQLHALLLLPDGPVPPGGFPAIVALHGCSGMYSATRAARTSCRERLLARAEPLLGDGYAVLFPDSFGPRGRTEVCTIKRGERPITPVAAPARRARRARLPGGAGPTSTRERIALVGWSHGGSTTLATINVRDREVAAFRDRAGCAAVLSRRRRVLSRLRRFAARRRPLAARRADAHPHRRARRLDAAEALRRARRSDGRARRAGEGHRVSRQPSRRSTRRRGRSCCAPTFPTASTRGRACTSAPTRRCARRRTPRCARF